MEHNYKILVIEDDKIVSNLLKKFLEMRGHKVFCYEYPGEGLQAFKQLTFDVCLLDLSLPGMNGIQVAEEIRDVDEFIPILFISSHAKAEDRIEALRTGADDFITKPINMEEVLLRIEAVMKRLHAAPMKGERLEETLQEIQIGTYLLDIPHQCLVHDNFIRKLTAKETELIRYLYLHRNQLIRRDLILMEVWGSNDYYKARSMDVFMSRVRKYLQDDPSIEIINVHGIGFKFVVG